VITSKGERKRSDWSEKRGSDCLESGERRGAQTRDREMQAGSTLDQAGRQRDGDKPD
jgi:hypothetical protein